MSLMNKLMKYGVATKAINEARKPQNQDKAKNLVKNLVDRRKNKPTPPTGV